MHVSKTPLRYPGGKGRLSLFIRLIFEQNGLLDGHYIEGYAGGAGIAIDLLLLQYASCIHLNDVDRAVFAFWHSVLNSTNELCKRVRETPLTVESWREQKAIHKDGDNHDLLDLGFATFFLNRTNRSGILTGGVIGGLDQTGPWKLDARFNAKDLCKRIESIAFYKKRVRLYNLDAAHLIKGVFPSLPQKSLAYLDPPYYLKGNRLYQNYYKHHDHETLAKLVKTKISIPWVVSYDDAPEIKKLYSTCRKISYEMNHTAAKNRVGSEVMFFSKGLEIPDVDNPSALRAA